MSRWDKPGLENQWIGKTVGDRALHSPHGVELPIGSVERSVKPLSL